MNRILNWRALLLALTCILLLSVSTACTRSDEPVKPTPAADAAYPGQLAPDFTLKTINNNEVKLSSLRGKKVFLNFWASWCAPCKNEMPDLQAMSRKYEDKVTLYGVNMLSDDDRDTVERFMLENRLTFPSVLDANGDVKKSYAILGLPVSITIDENGRVLERHQGQLKQGEMEAMFQHLLASK